jgi:hypothetical protein
MNLKQLKKNIGSRVRLRPAAIHLARDGLELPARDDDWVLADVTDTDVHLQDTSTSPLKAVLGADVVHRFDSDASRSKAAGLQHGFLVLMQQMLIQADKIDYLSCPWPGARVPPPPPQVPASITEMSVDLNYIELSGLQARLRGEGYEIRWVGVSRVPTVELDGWEAIVHSDRRGNLVNLYIRTRPEDMVLVGRLVRARP